MLTPSNRSTLNLFHSTHIKRLIKHMQRSTISNSDTFSYNFTTNKNFNKSTIDIPYTIKNIIKNSFSIIDLLLINFFFIINSRINIFSFITRNFKESSRKEFLSRIFLFKIIISKTSKCINTIRLNIILHIMLI